MISRSRRYMWLIQRQMNLMNGTLFVLKEKNKNKTTYFCKSFHNLMSRGSEKKIHIGGQMSIAKKTSTTLASLSLSFSLSSLSSLSWSLYLFWLYSYTHSLSSQYHHYLPPWLCWLSKASLLSTVHLDRIEPVSKNQLYYYSDLSWTGVLAAKNHSHLVVALN